MGDGLRSAAARGMSWTGLAQGTGYLITLVGLGLAARFLRAEDFGIEAAGVLVVGVWTIAADLGMSRALVQRRDLRPGHLSAAFWMGLTTSCICAVLLWRTARMWGELLLEDPAPVAAILPTLALGVVCTGIGAVPRARMERAFRFQGLAILDFCAILLWGLTLVSLAAAGRGVWSLVWAYVVRSAVLGLGPWLLSPVVPIGRFGPKDVRELVGFGGNWTGSQLVSHVQQNLDYFLIGRFLGDGALGYYRLARRLVEFPQVRLMQVVSKVTFPVFSAVQTDLPRLGRAYLSTVRHVALVVFPIMAGLGLLADPGITLLYGAAYVSAVVPVLRILSPGGAARAVGAATGLAFLSTGRAWLALLWNLGAGVVMLGAVWMGVGGGITGVALAVAVSGIVLTFVSQGIVNRIVGFGFSEYLRALWPAAVCCAIALVGIGLYRMVVGEGLSASWELGTCLCLGGAIYAFALRFVTPATWEEARDLVQLAWRDGPGEGACVGSSRPNRVD